MKNLKVFQIATAFLLIVNFLLLFLLFKSGENTKNKNQLLMSRQNRVNDLEQIVGMLKVLGIKAVFAPTYLKVDPQVRPLLKSNKTICLRIHGDDCNDCVRQSVQSLLEFKKNNPTFDIVVIANYKDLEKLRHDFPMMPFPIHLIKVINLDQPKTKSPYVFFVNNKDRYESVFFPNYLAMDMFDGYLKNILND